MKVASILEDARWGGPQSRLVQTSIALEVNDVDHTAIIPEQDNKRLKTELEKTSSAIRELPLTRPRRDFMKIMGYFFRFPYEIFVIARILVLDQIDILHVQGGAWQLKGAVAAFCTGKKVVWHLNDTSIPRPIKLLFSIVAFVTAHMFVVQGEAVRSYYLNGILRNKKHEQIFGIVDSKFFEGSSTKSKNKRFSVAMVATATPNKNYMRLLDIANALKMKGVVVDFYVVGRVNANHKAYFDNVTKKQERDGLENVHFLGECYDVKSFLDKADIYLCCSNNEASPTSVWEGMATGMPAITTDVGNVRQVIRHGIDGYICRHDAIDLADKINFLLHEKEGRRQMGASAKCRVSDMFGVKENGLRLKSIYETLLKIRTEP